MKKYFFPFAVAAMAMVAAPTFVACDDDDDDKVYNDTASFDGSLAGLSEKEVAILNKGITSDNVSSWGNYMRIVANLLVTDAQTLYDNWNTKADGKTVSYAEYFKSLPGLEAAEQIVDGCHEISNEVDDAKIGDPLGLYEKGETGKALLAVESWFSWHSRVDYSNNILSVRNAIFGVYSSKAADAVEPAANSLAAAVKAVDEAAYNEINNAIVAAYKAILAIPQPFRNNINSTEAKNAQNKCAELTDILDGSFKASLEKVDAATLKTVAAAYVDDVVLPTYADLLTYNKALQTAVIAFQAAPSSVTLTACGVAWLAARQPWETSEAFLFGPVGDLGLDPNMDSWPLDLVGIDNVLESGDFAELDWTGDYDEESEKKKIEAAQALRGFHTLEFLIYKNGEVRKY